MAKIEDDFNTLKSLMTQLKIVEGQLERHLEEDFKEPNVEPDVRKALKALQHGLTQHTANLVINNLQASKPDDLKFAVKLVQIYLEQTKPQQHVLIAFQKNHDKTDPKPDRVTPPLSDKYNNKDLYFIVLGLRNDLYESLLNLQRDLHLIITGVGESLPADDYCDLQAKVIPEEFIAYLQETKRVLDALRRRDESLTASEVDKLTKNWGCAIAFFNDPDKNSPGSDISNFDIAKSIQIHNLLEANYSELAELVRTSDLLNPAIL